jgi:ferredoxin-NADP reductase
MLFNKNPDDIKRFMEMNNDRRKIIDETPATPLPKTYGVNELSKSLHPGVIPAKIVSITEVCNNIKTIRLESISDNKRFPYFKAGQFVTLSTNVGDSFITRPYSISSSPFEAMKGILEVSVQKAGFFSTYLLEEAKVGDTIIVGEPSGDFYYDNLRDSKNVVAIAGGSGVTPFMSMIKSLNENSDDFNLTLIYGARTRKDLLVDYKDIKSDKVKLVVVLSEEEVEGYEHGFITKDLLEKYLPSEYSVFMCGPDGMYKFVRGEFDKLGVNKYKIRQEHNSIGTRNIENPRTFTLKVHMRDEIFTIPALENETLLSAMERAGLKAPSRCKSGSCGFCHSRLISGEYFVNKEHEYRRAADLKFGYIHPCCTYPESDMEIDVPPFNVGGNK